jgi:hypothetical protein
MTHNLRPTTRGLDIAFVDLRERFFTMARFRPGTQRRVSCRADKRSSSTSSRPPSEQRSPTRPAGLVFRATTELRIIIELTERALLQDPSEVLRIVAWARAHGWGIALDDVGADLAPDDTLAGEWTVIVVGSHYAGALIAKDCGVLDAARPLISRLVPLS